MLSKVDILKKVVETLESKQRAVITDDAGFGRCRYNVELSGELCHCAVGMFLLPEHQTVEFELNDKPLADMERQAKFDSYLIPEARGHDMQFWRALQCLHDEEEFWTAHNNDRPGQVLTRSGMIEFDNILEKFCTKDEFKANYLTKD